MRIDRRHNDFVFSVDDTSVFTATTEVVQNEIVHFLVLEASGSSLDYEQTQRVVSLAISPLQNGTKMRSVSLTGGWIAQRIGKMFRLTRESVEEQWQECQTQSAVFRHPAFCSLNIQEYSTFDGDDTADDTIAFHVNQQVLEESSNCLQICLRHPLEGDYIKPSALVGDKDMKLTTFLKNEGVALHMRDRVLVLVRDNDGKRGVLGVMLPGENGLYSPRVAVDHQCKKSINNDGVVFCLQIL